MTESRQIVVVGASLAGVSAAESLRREGFTGKIVLIGAEDCLPYDRPPLSKQVLGGEWDPVRIQLRRPEFYVDNEIELRLGTPVGSLDLPRKHVVLSDRSRLPYDGLVIATGASPRPLPVPGFDAAGVYLLRTVGDSLALAQVLNRSDARVVVIGAGFIGAEVAAVARDAGASVTILEAADRPLARLFGGYVSDACAKLHRSRGVDLRCGVVVRAIESGPTGPVVLLGDGSAIAADAVIVGIGASPQVGWLKGSGLTLSDGVVCDEFCFAGPDVVAAGDVARWDHPNLGTIRLEHWTNAAEQARAAAHNLLVGRGASTAFAPIPYFWSDQYGTRIQMAGRPKPRDGFELTASIDEPEEFTGIYRTSDGDISAVLGFGARKAFLQLRRDFIAAHAAPTARA